MEEKKINEQEELKSQEESATTEEIKTNQESSEEKLPNAEPSLTDKSSTDTISTGADVVATKKKVSKKKLGIIIGIVGFVAVIAIVLVIVLIPSEFDKVKKECVEIGSGTVTTGKGYFTIDTNPDYMSEIGTGGEYEDIVKDALLNVYQDNAIEAIQYANKELGFPDSVYSRMLRTNALMGRQSEENGKYVVSWTYHPDDGLVVTYRKK
ncbi:hypothetical protein B0O40_1443 [Ruminococcaceae bacterium R-25]|nr:hypothetical protein B0O40_1443 [Ruminococcaceae bacterium R-25]SUQ12051.1 hypothetical protein SAMN06297423_1443 [Oscillospiraceae bacterium]